MYNNYVVFSARHESTATSWGTTGRFLVKSFGFCGHKRTGSGTGAEEE